MRHHRDETLILRRYSPVVLITLDIDNETIETIIIQLEYIIPNLSECVCDQEPGDILRFTI